MRLSQRRLFEIVDEIYSASLQPAAWQRVVDAIHAMNPAVGANLQGYQKGNPPRLILAHQGYDPDFVHRYQEHYAAVNPWAARVPRMPVGVPHVIDESEYLPQVRKTGFHSFLVKNGWGSGVGTPVWAVPERFFFIVIDYPHQRGDKLNEPAERLSGLLSPHLARSFGISHRLGVADTDHGGLASFLARTVSPIFVLDHARRVRFANAAGEQLLATSSLFRQPSAGRLHLKEAAADAALAEAVKACAAGPIALAAPLLIHAAAAGGAFRIAVMPIFADGSLSRGAKGSFLVAERLTLLLFIHGDASADARSLFRQAFGLTPAEAELAVALSDGEGLAEYASGRGLALATVRNQLQAIFGKTATHRQAELVALLSNLKRGHTVQARGSRPQRS